jgi:hypothetical protein
MQYTSIRIYLLLIYLLFTSTCALCPACLCLHSSFFSRLSFTAFG